MDTFSALAEPTRRTILELLSEEGQLSASDISDHFEISPPAISQHLKVLREANLVQMERRAQQRLYTINPEPITELEGWIKKMSRQWEDRFTALDAVLKVEKKKLNTKGKGVSGSWKK